MPPQLLGDFRCSLGGDAGWLRASSMLQASPLAPAVGVWGLQTGSHCAFSSCLDTSGLSCFQFCDNFCYRARSVRPHRCWLPNHLLVCLMASTWDWGKTGGSPGCSVGLSHCGWVLCPVPAHLGLELRLQQSRANCTSFFSSVERQEAQTDR